MKLQATPFGIFERLKELVDNLAEMQYALENGENTVELSTVDFVTPLAILPLAVYANNNGLTVDCKDDPYKAACSYLDTIGFQKGINEFSKVDKRYLPITKLPISEGSEMLGEYEERMLSQTNIEKVVLKHLTSELVNNVNEHAQIDHYWLLAQSYRMTPQTVEIVFSDCGIGLRKSYEGTKFEVKTDREAIINALEGRSSKTELNGRGFGIPSIVKILCALGGKLVIISGDTMIYYKQNERNELQLKSYWQGSLVGINFTPRPIDFYKCVS